MASRNELYSIAHNIHMTERALEDLSEQWDLYELVLAQRSTHASTNTDGDNDRPPPLVQDSDDEDSDDDDGPPPLVSDSDDD